MSWIREPATRSLLLFLCATSVFGQVAKFRVRESGGLRRFNFPVRHSISSDGVDLVLFENGKQVPAQFTAREPGIVEIDFNASPGPEEVIEYRVEKAAAPDAAPSTITVTQADGVFTVRVGAQQYVVPENLTSLLRQATGGPRIYVRPGSRGLLLTSKDGTESEFTATKATVTKRGPLVAALRFESAKGAVELEFPRSKSWVEVRWSVNDSGVAAMTADLNLALEGTPTLVDFGANSTVYGALREKQRFRLSAGPQTPGWQVHLDEALFANSLKTIAEGWAHIMDQQKASAIVVEDFGRKSQDRIDVSAAGNVQIKRILAPNSPRLMHFWVHFVPMPVQVGAATSPQAILSPLSAESIVTK